MASVNTHPNAHVSLVFHTGAAIAGDHPLLEGGGDTTRYIKFVGSDADPSPEPALRAVLNAWCEGCDAAR